jgi:putative aldouronate transport system substrate-binding protein
MKKTMRLVFLGILVFAIVIAGCSNNNAGTTKTGNNSVNTDGTNNDKNGNSGDSSPVTIRVFANQGTDTDFATNLFTKYIEEKVGISFQWTTVPFDGAAEKRQISIASGDYPDLYMLIPWVDKFSQLDLLRFGEQGVILPLNDLIDQYAPNIKEALDKNPYYKAMNTAPDGTIYGLTGLNECYHCSYPNKMWINTKWLEQLKLDMPKTTEEFRNVLRAFKTQDPNGNGKRDEVPLSGSTESYGVRIIPYLMNGFIYDDDRNHMILRDGKVDTAANKPEWKEGLAYIKSLYDEGLIDPGAFTQNAEAFKKIGENADAQLLGAGAGMHPAIFVETGPGNKYGSDYNPLESLAGPHASYATFNYPVEPGATFVLTNKASEKVQIAAIKMLDYIYTQEGQLLSNYGEEGKDWRKPQSGDVPIEEGAAGIYATIPSEPGAAPRNSHWGPTAQYNHSKDFRNGWIQATDIYKPEGFERRLQEATHLYDGKQPESIFPHWAMWVDPAAADEASMLQTNIRDYIDQNSLQFVTGNKSLDKDWDSYVKGLDDLNLQRYLAIMQQSYDSSSLTK